MFKSKIKKIIITLLIFTPLANISLAEDNPSLFETVEFKSSNFNSVPKWVKILDRMLLENNNFQSCENDLINCNNEFLKQWLFFLKQSKDIESKEDLL
ncbi:MAG TPA: hypothetical protein DCL21_02865, partial [Alphaproteobacteria bacterium]|nr:hypothetical protein [Alphaproteobacteria bacterium]